MSNGFIKVTLLTEHSESLIMQGYPKYQSDIAYIRVSDVQMFNEYARDFDGYKVLSEIVVNDTSYRCLESLPYLCEVIFKPINHSSIN